MKQKMWLWLLWCTQKLSTAHCGWCAWPLKCWLFGKVADSLSKPNRIHRRFSEGTPSCEMPGRSQCSLSEQSSSWRCHGIRTNWSNKVSSLPRYSNMPSVTACQVQLHHKLLQHMKLPGISCDLSVDKPNMKPMNAQWCMSQWNSEQWVEQWTVSGTGNFGWNYEQPVEQRTVRPRKKHWPRKTIPLNQHYR